MIVVSDSSPLIALADVGQLRLLHELFSTVLIPEAVYQEIVVQGAGRTGAEAVQAAAWIEQRSVANTGLADVLKLELDEGEAEAIALALESGADLVLLDERRGRQRAARLGLRVTGVLGVLVEAKHQHLLAAVRPVLDALRDEAGFWISDDLYRRVLDLAGEAS